MYGLLADTYHKSKLSLGTYVSYMDGMGKVVVSQRFLRNLEFLDSKGLARSIGVCDE